MDNQNVTAADIARIARVSRTTVSNWRRRHGDFPPPVGGAGNRALFDRAQVEEWLARGGRLPERAPHERIWERVLAATGAGADLGEVVADVQELLLVLFEDGAGAVDAAEKTLTEHPDGGDLNRALREVAATPERARELSVHLHDAYVGALGGKAHITPGSLGRLMAELAGVKGAEVFDPACGGGTLLHAAALEGAARVHGQEVVPDTVRMARARMGLLAQDTVGEIVEGDSLTGDAFTGRRFDAVLCNPSFNQRDWGAEQLAYDERWAYGVPPRAESELAWIQHCLAHTRPGGTAVVLMPPAAASRPSGRRIRRELLRRGALRAVIGLPVGAAAPVHVGLHLWVLTQLDPGKAAQPWTLFVDTDTGVGEERGGRDGNEGRAADWDTLHRSVVEAWKGFRRAPERFADVPGLCRAVSVVELLDDSVDLTPQRHLPVAVPEANAREARQGAGRVRRRLFRALEDTHSSVPGGGWHEREAGEWRMTTVDDLARSGALTVYQGSPSPVVAPEEGGGPRVLTPEDVDDDGEPGKRLPEPVDPESTGHRVIRAGDVIVPSAMARGRTPRIRVATDTDAGALLGHSLYLVRPDPDHIDPWFLAGFLQDEDNMRRAGHGSSVLRVDFRRLRLPLLPLEEQRRYGAAFRELRGFRRRLDKAREAAGELEQRLTSGLRTGLLAPPRPGAEEAAEAVTDAPRIGQT